MSNLRWINRDGKMILQQQDTEKPMIHKDLPDYLIWRDVPMHEEPKESEYVIANACDCAGQSSKVNTRLIDERLVNKLVEALEFCLLDYPKSCGRKAMSALEQYRKHVPVKK